MAYGDRPNPIINNLPSSARTMIKKLSENNDPEVLCTWLLAWVTQQMIEACELIEQKFLPVEITALKEALKDGDFSPANPPSGEYLAKLMREDKLVSSQAKTLSPQELLYLALEQYKDALSDSVFNTREYLSARDFANALNPKRSKERVVFLCKEGRVPGSFKSTYDGQWRIPATSVAIVEAELNPLRDKMYYGGDVRVD